MFGQRSTFSLNTRFRVSTLGMAIVSSLFLNFLSACIALPQTVSVNTITVVTSPVSMEELLSPNIAVDTEDSSRVTEDPLPFDVQIRASLFHPHWIHMLVGSPRGKSTANVSWAQFLGTADKANREVFIPRTDSYLPATGSMQEGRKWAGCDPPESVSPIDTLIYFQNSREVDMCL